MERMVESVNKPLTKVENCVLNINLFFHLTVASQSSQPLVLWGNTTFRQGRIHTVGYQGLHRASDACVHTLISGAHGLCARHYAWPGQRERTRPWPSRDPRTSGLNNQRATYYTPGPRHCWSCFNSETWKASKRSIV